MYQYFIYLKKWLIYLNQPLNVINTVCTSSTYGDQEVTKQKAMSVYIDDETALALNRLREEIRQKNESDGLPAQTPTIGWLGPYSAA